MLLSQPERTKTSTISSALTDLFSYHPSLPSVFPSTLSRFYPTLDASINSLSPGLHNPHTFLHLFPLCTLQWAHYRPADSRETAMAKPYPDIAFYNLPRAGMSDIFPPSYLSLGLWSPKGKQPVAGTLGAWRRLYFFLNPRKTILTYIVMQLPKARTSLQVYYTEGNGSPESFSHTAQLPQMLAAKPEPVTRVLRLSAPSFLCTITEKSSYGSRWRTWEDSKKVLSALEAQSSGTGVPELKAIMVCTYQSPFISLSPSVTFIIKNTGTREGHKLESEECSGALAAFRGFLFHF